MVEGEHPCYGNGDDSVDIFAKEITHEFLTELKKHKTYRGAEHTLSVLTITSNVMYGKKQGQLLMAVKLVKHLLRALIQCMVVIIKNCHCSD